MTRSTTPSSAGSATDAGPPDSQNSNRIGCRSSRHPILLSMSDTAPPGTRTFGDVRRNVLALRCESADLHRATRHPGHVIDTVTSLFGTSSMDALIKTGFRCTHVRQVPTFDLYMAYEKKAIVTVSGETYLTGPAIVCYCLDDELWDISSGDAGLVRRLFEERTVQLRHGDETIPAIAL